MISRILVPIDGPEMVQHALEYALENHPDAEIAVLHVVGEPSPWGGAATSLALEEDVEEAAEERAEDIFDDAKKLAAEYDVEITTEVQLGHSARAIVTAPTISMRSSSGATADR